MKTHTEMMMEAGSPYKNYYQGNDKKVLFVCSAGILRSATGARLYAKKYNTRCAGSEGYALIPVTSDLLLWANEVVFVNMDNFASVSKNFDLNEINYKVLNIPDNYEHMDPNLIAAFDTQYEHIGE